MRVGVDMEHGGTVNFLAKSPDGENLINIHDLGRQVQQSNYSGPQPFGEAHPNWKDWPWNLIGTGDPELERRAKAILRRILHLQDQDLKSKT